MSPMVDEDGNSVYQRKNGCSMATPFVTGAAVVLKQMYGGDPGALRARLIEDARTAYPGRGGDHPERLMVFRDPFAESGCGDGVCLGDETDVTCGEDRGCGGALSCEDVAPFGCYCDPDCAANGDCCADAEAVCPAS